MHVIKLLRDYLGLSQAELSKRAGITQADLSEMEHKAPYGQIAKYQRLAAALNTTVQSLLMNDANSIPLSFFDTAGTPEYNDALPMDHTILGRQGEELALQMERAKLENITPVLSKLVMPYYKMKVPSPGFDILSFQSDGTPIYIEVKTTENTDASTFQLTKREHSTAERVTQSGERYLIYHFTAWGSHRQKLSIYNFAELVSENRVAPIKYVCSLTEHSDTISGILYYRNQLDLTQLELSNRTGIPTTTLCKYEQGINAPSVAACIKLSEFFDVPVDALLVSYPTNTEFTTN